TRSKRDWSSDVCSSDLLAIHLFPDRADWIVACNIQCKALQIPFRAPLKGGQQQIAHGGVVVVYDLLLQSGCFGDSPGGDRCIARSEERRVGKGGSMRGV